MCEVRARLKDDPRIIEGTDCFTHAPVDKDKTNRLQMVHRDNHIALQHTSEVDIAVLNSRVTNVIGALRHLDGIRYEVLVSTVELSGAISSWVNKGKTTDFDVEIIIYGPRTYYDEIGAILSKSGFFLQIPRYRTHNIPYQNPHFWELGFFSSPLLSPDPMPDHTANPVSEVTSMLDTLDQREFLNLAAIDERIIKPLLR